MADRTSQYIDRLQAVIAFADSKDLGAISVTVLVGGISVSLASARLAGQPPFAGSGLDPWGVYLIPRLLGLVGVSWTLFHGIRTLQPRARAREAGHEGENSFFYGDAASMDFDITQVMSLA
jgi:hypothetical protein